MRPQFVDQARGEMGRGAEQTLTGAGLQHQAVRVRAQGDFAAVLVAPGCNLLQAFAVPVRDRVEKSSAHHSGPVLN